MKSVLLIVLSALTSSFFSAVNADDLCSIRNTTFQAGETLDFKIYYSVASLYFSGGEASFSASLELMGSRPVYHIVGTGKTNHFVDNTFKVRDKYETYVDTATLRPYKFIRNVLEGNTKIYENVTFVKETNTAITSTGVYHLPSCTFDILSAMYSARNINFNQYQQGDKIPFTVFLHDEVFPLYIRYLGKETIKTKMGKYKAIKFKPLLIKGTIFTGGEKMTVWISDDSNHLPLRVESPITIGKIAVELISSKNILHSTTSLKP
jgi:hypothetical protein